MADEFSQITPAGALTLYVEFNRQFPGRLFEFDPIDTGPTGDDFAVRGFDPVTALNFDFRVTADGSTASFAFFPNQPGPQAEPPAPEVPPGPDTFDFRGFTPDLTPPGAGFAAYDQSNDRWGGPVDLFAGTAFFFGGYGYGAGGGGFDFRPIAYSSFTEDLLDQENYGFEDGIW